MFDETTSALDTVTEAAMMETIEELSKDFTLVIIAHRLSTISSCDPVIELAKGTVEKSFSANTMTIFTLLNQQFR